MRSDGGLDKSHLRNFWKRLRKLTGPGLKHLSCGEYGDEGLRPHYHSAVWGWNWTDKVFAHKSRKGFPLYSSPTLDAAWTCPECKRVLGMALIGDLTYDSAAYVASYTTKKITGSKSFWHYLRLVDDGEYVSVEPEFSSSSRGNGRGLAYGFYERFFTDLFPKDYCVLASEKGNKKVPVPRYYRRLLEEDPRFCRRVLARQLKEKRVEKAQEVAEDTPELRAARNATLVAERALYGHPDVEPSTRVLDHWIRGASRPPDPGSHYARVARQKRFSTSKEATTQ